MRNQILTIEQMKYLISIGIDTKNASMSYSIHRQIGNIYIKVGYDEDSPNIMFDIVPAFTIQDIIDILPVSIKIENEEYWLEFSVDEHIGGERIYYVQYRLIENGTCLELHSNILLINALYTMLVWCHMYGFIDEKFLTKK